MGSLLSSSRKRRKGAVFLLRTLLEFDALVERLCDEVTSGSKSDMTCMMVFKGGSSLFLQGLLPEYLTVANLGFVSCQWCLLFRLCLGALYFRR
jgi:hypothetical protein